MFASESYNPWAIAWRCLRDSVFSGFDTIPVCDRQTDGQTDRWTAAYTKTVVSHADVIAVALPSPAEFHLHRGKQ